MKRLLFVFVALLATSCEQLKGGDPVVTTSGKVPIPTVVQKEVTIQWASPAPGSPPVQGYKIEASGDGSNFFEAGTVDGTANGVIVTLNAGMTYYFRVRAFSQGGNSAYTQSVSIAL